MARCPLHLHHIFIYSIIVFLVWFVCLLDAWFAYYYLLHCIVSPNFARLRMEMTLPMWTSLQSKHDFTLNVFVVPRLLLQCSRTVLPVVLQWKKRKSRWLAVLQQNVGEICIQFLFHGVSQWVSLR